MSDFQLDGVTQDQMRARLFLFSLLGKALQWFHSQPAEKVQDWNALMRVFIKEYYSPGKTQSLRNKIATFAQYPTETISEAFECFNEYTRAVPHHKFLKIATGRVRGGSSARGPGLETRQDNLNPPRTPLRVRICPRPRIRQVPETRQVPRNPRIV
jgi:hypothetical protein